MAVNLAKLETDGYVVISMEDLGADFARLKDTILHSICEIKPELLQRCIDKLDTPVSPASPQVLVMGGFGGLGFPSTMHCPAARQLRELVYDKMYPLFEDVFNGRNLEMLYDRFGIRRNGTTLSAESWHRDVGYKSIGDIIFGGWLNLDNYNTEYVDNTQYFVCAPTRFLPAPNEDTHGKETGYSHGFEKIEKGDRPYFENRSKKIPIPPYHLIIFNQTIAHKIANTKITRTSFRQYFGWRITDDNEPYLSKTDIIINQGMPRLPSGQECPMYGKNHWMNWTDRIVEFSQAIKEVFHEQKWMETRKQSYDVVKQFMPDLASVGMKFERYSVRDIAIMYPRILVAGGCALSADEQNGRIRPLALKGMFQQFPVAGKQKPKAAQANKPVQAAAKSDRQVKRAAVAAASDSDSQPVQEVSSAIAARPTPMVIDSDGDNIRNAATPDKPVKRSAASDPDSRPVAARPKHTVVNSDGDSIDSSNPEHLRRYLEGDMGNLSAKHFNTLNRYVPPPPATEQMDSRDSTSKRDRTSDAESEGEESDTSHESSNGSSTDQDVDKGADANSDDELESEVDEGANFDQDAPRSPTSNEGKDESESEGEKDSDTEAEAEEELEAEQESNDEDEPESTSDQESNESVTSKSNSGSSKTESSKSKSGSSTGSSKSSSSTSGSDSSKTSSNKKSNSEVGSDNQDDEYSEEDRRLNYK